MTNKFWLFSLLSVCLVLFATGSSVFATGGDVWEPVASEAIRSRNGLPIDGDKFLVYRINAVAAKAILSEAPMEFSDDARRGTFTFQLPMPSGKLEAFRVVESPVLSPALQADFPDWRTYQAYGIDDPTATARFGITANGFHASVFSTKGTVIIDPINVGDTQNYIVYSKPDFKSDRKFHCRFDETISGHSDTNYSFFSAPEFSHGAQLRTYRLAVATTFEYTQLFRQAGDTDPQAQTRAFNQVVISVNRIIGVYRKEVAVSFTLVAGTNLTFVVNPETPGDYANNGSTSDLTVNQTNVNSIIGAANYDIGHLFQTSDGGVAQLSSVCGASKARGLSGLPNPTGDPFDVDYVAHEMGHQFGGNHTFNAAPNCGSSPIAARKEPGSAVTIMGYAGICSSSANVARNSIDTFHVYNQTEIITFLGGTGGTCGALSGTNAIPVVTPPANFTIPFNTPFELTASATDGDNDPLTYSWEQNDSGASQSSYPGTTDDDDAGLVFRPGFRSYLPHTTGSRIFPSPVYILDNSNEAPITFSGTSATGTICAGTCITGEDLPSAARTMNFRVTVRDGNGGVADAGTAVTVVNTTTAFAVTSQNTAVTYNGNSSQTVTWNVSGTAAAPISAANVKISLSTDGGQTFPNVLAASTANDGTETVTIPNIATTTARVKVEAVGNIFFDISNVNFTINASAVTLRAPFDYDGDDRTDISIYRPTPGEWWYLRSSNSTVFAVAFGSPTDKPVPGDYTGDQKTDIAFWRPSTSQWFILRSEDLNFFAFPFGATGDIPVPGDYDNDGKTDAAVFRPSTANWFILKSTGGVDIFTFGASTDKPVVGDYDGDGKTDMAIFRPSVGQWWIRRSSDTGLTILTFGTAMDKPVQGYYTADNKTDVAFWRPSTGEWFILRSEDLAFFAFPFGANGDIPAPGDYDGDDRFDAAVFRPTGSTWFVNRTTAGLLIQGFGSPTDLPTPASFVP